MEAVKALLLIALLPPALIAGPVNYSWQDGVGTRSQCSTTCTETSKFNYEVGKTYRYAYEVTGVSSIPGASEESSRVFASANARIHVISKCELALSLSDVSFKTSDPDSSTLRDVGDFQYTSRLEENPLFFSFQDGRVEDICPDVGDDKEMLNFKRGILSAFQNSMSQHNTAQSKREIDVSGNCPTEYVVTQKGWKSTEITKSKDLLGCTDRQHYKTSLQSTPFHVPDAIQSLPLLKGDHKCSHTLSKDGILSLATCVESLIFRPFSRKESGAKTETTQKLEYIDTSSTYDRISASISRKSTLNFEHVSKGDNDEQEIWAVRDKLEQLCRSSSTHGVEKQVPGYFTELVYLMKELHYNALNDLWAGVKTELISAEYKEVAKDFYLDALPMVGTDDSVKVMVDLLVSDEVTGVRADLWLKSFAFLHHPNENMIKESLKRLLESEKYRMDSLLPVTSVIHNYCLQQTECQTNRAVVEVVSILDDILGRDCRSTDANLILTTLRAVGNLGFSDSLVSTLENCIEMSANSMNVRVTAVQAFRGVTCNAQRSSLIDVFVNKAEDSELRINAYLGVMMCPTHSVLERVKATLETEEVDQVGSFVWTHLTNLAETSNPHKQDLKAILQDEKLRAEFDMDKRKYSRNIEMSYFSDKFGTGAAAESNLIWSSSSFLPRSMMLNLTVDVLGHSMNLFEVGGRVQGLQELLHDYLGSKLRPTEGETQSGNNPSNCAKQGKMDDMKEKHAVQSEEFAVSMYLRMFGNEMEYNHFTLRDIMALKDKFDSRQMIRSLANGEDVSFTHSAMFLDSTVTVPTIAGMAVQLSVNGTATVQLKASGKMDLRRIARSKMDIHFDLAPSAAVQIGGEMTLNAGIMKSGLKMTTTLHTSTAFTGKLELSEGRILSVTADTPRERTELFDMQSEFFLIHTNAVRPQKMLEERASTRQTGCSNGVWLTVLGYELCGDASFVYANMIKEAPYFPLTGPSSVSVVLHKRDAPQGFKLVAENVQNARSSIIRLSIDTPDSTTDRKLSLSSFITHDDDSYSIDMGAESPWKKVTFTGLVGPNGDPDTMEVSGTMVVDQDTYELKFKYDREEEGRQIIIKPTLQIVRPRNSRFLAKVPETVSVSGTLSSHKNLQDMSMDLTILTNLRPNPIKVQGNYVNKKGQRTLSGNVILNRNQGYSATFQVMETYFARNDYPSKIKPTVLISAPNWRPFLLSGNIDFKKNKFLKSGIQIKMERTLTDPVILSMKGTQSKGKFKGQGKLTSQFGTIKSKGFIDLPLEGKKKGHLLSTKITTSYNLPVIKDRTLRKNLVVLSSKIQDRSSKALIKYDGSMTLESRNYQKASFVAGMSFSHKASSTKSVLTYKGGPKSRNLKDKSKQLKIETSLDHKIGSRDVEIKYDVQILYPIQAIEWQLNGKHEHHLRKKIAIETYNSFIYAKGKSSEFRLKIDDNSKKMKQYNGLLEFNYPDFRFVGRRINGRAYRLVSTLEQTSSKEYSQSLQVTINKALEHTMYTKVKYFRNYDYELSSQIDIGSGENTKITVLGNYLNDKRETSVKVNRDGEIYEGAASVTEARMQWITTWDVSWPERRVKGSWDINAKTVGEYKTNFEALWDADRDATKKIDADLTYIQMEKPKASKFDFDMSVNTPFEGYKAFAFKRLVELNQKEKKDEFKVVWRQPQDELSYKMWLLNPATLERFQTDIEIVTPYEDFRMFRTEVRHKFASPNYLSTSVLAKYNENDVSANILATTRKNELQNKQDCKLEINLIGAKRNTLEMKIGDFTDVSTFMPLTPSVPKSMKFKLAHDNNGRIYNSEIALSRDDDQSKIEHQATYTRVGKMVNLKSNIEIFLHDLMVEPVQVELEHANTLTNLNTTLTTKIGSDSRASLDVGITFLANDQTLFVHYSGTTKSVHDLIYKHRHNNLNGWSGSSFAQVNKDMRYQSGSTYKISKTELNFETFSPTSKTTLKAEYDSYPYTGSLKYSFMEPRTNRWQDILLDGSVVRNSQRDWTGDLRLVTPFEQAKNIDVKGNLKDVGRNIWSLDGDISYGVRKDIKLKASVDTNKFSSIKAELESPWRNVEVEITQRQQRKNVKAEAKIILDKGTPIVAKFNGRLRLPEKSAFSLDLTTPYADFRSANLKGHLLQTGDKWSGDLNFKFLNNKWRFINMDFGTELRELFFDQNIKLTSSEDMLNVEARCMMEIHDHENAFEVKLISPDVGRNVLGFNTKSNSWVDFTQRWYGEIKEQDLDMGYSLKHDELQTKASLTFNYPGAEKSFVKANLHRIGNQLNDFDIGADLQIGRNTVPYNASAQFSYIEGKAAAGTTFTSPFTDPFSFLVKQEMTKFSQTRIIYGKYDDSYMIDVYDTYDLTDSTYTNTRRNGYLFKGEGHTAGYTVDTEWSDDGEEFSVQCNCDDIVVAIQGNHIPQEFGADDQDTIDVYMTTPFDDFKDIELHHYYKKEGDGAHSGKIVVEYSDGKEAELTYDVKKRHNKVTANGMLALPISGYERNSISLSVINRRNVLTADAEATTGKGENLKATLEYRNNEEFIFTLVGPIKEFKNLKIAGKFNEGDQTLNGDIQLQLSLHPRPVSLEYDINLKNKANIMTFRLRSPYTNFKRADLTINRSGTRLVKSIITATLTSEQLGRIVLTGDLDYKSEVQMEGKVSFTSTLKNMENLRLLLKTEPDNEKKEFASAQFEVGWDSNKEIVIKTGLNEDESSTKRYTYTFDMTTPFEEVKVLGIKLEEQFGPVIIRRSVFARHNDRTYVDTDVNLHYNEAERLHSVGLEMRQPRPMSVSGEGKLEDKKFDGKVLLNWDKRKPESQFEFNLRVADKSDQSNIDTDFSFKVIHPVRIMAVEYLLRKSNTEMQTSGLITWDESEGNTFSYDVGYTDRSSIYSEMYDAHVKVGVPQRSVKLLGSYGDTGSSRSMTATALWDADRDDRKKVTMTTTHEYSERMERVNLDLNLPSISKQLNVGVSLKRGYGANILDSKTEISYSSDPKKTIHITNKIYDSYMDTTGRGDYNYTMETGFKHAVTDTDLQWLSHLSQVNNIVSVGHRFIYLTIDRKQKTFACRLETDNDKNGKLMIITPLKSVSFVGERFEQRGEPAFKVDLFENDQRTLSFAGKLLPRTKEFEVTMHYDRDEPTKAMYLTGAYVTDNSAEMTLYDEDNIYAKMNVRLNASNVIHSKILWKPNLPQEFQVFMATKVTAFSYTTTEVWDHMVKGVGAEVKAKYLRVSQELRDEIGEVFALVRREMELFNVQLETLRTQIRRIYNRNDLYIRDMGLQIDEALQEILDYIQDLVRNYRSYYNDVSRATIEWVNSLKNYPISLMYTNAVNDLMKRFEEMRFAMEDVLDIVVLKMKDMSDKAYKNYVSVSRDIDNKLNSYIQSHQKLAVFNQLVRQREQLVQMGADSNGLLAKELESFDGVIMQTQQVLEDQFHDLMSREEFQQLHAMGTEIYQQFKYWNHERGLSYALTRLLDMSKNLILMEIGKLKNTLMDIKKSRMTVFDPTKGELQFEIHTPFAMDSLSSPPEFKMADYVKDAYKWVENRVPALRNTSLQDIYVEYVPSLNPSQWVPPYEASGYVVGSQTVITFDKTNFDFMSKCSHVLVRDMLQDSFSVVLNYDRNPRANGIKSLCFSFGHSLSFEIFKDYRVTVNSQETEMPFVNDLVRIVRDGDSVSVEYVNGLRVILNPRTDLVKVTLSGWFHGRTAGLLGFYDNENHNEATLVDRMHEMEVDRRSCRGQNEAVTPQSIDVVGNLAKCNELFLFPESQFRSCFKQVDPSAFSRICQVYLSTMDLEDALRKVSQQYRSVCRDQGVYMSPLLGYDFFTCDTSRQLDGDEVKNSADVVFVVEDAKCNEWASSSLTNLVTEMNKALTKSGISNNRFGLVGYNGEDATVRTIHGQHFGQANSFLKAVETLRLDSTGTDGDVVTAVLNAKKYPYRIGVPVKILVVVPCTSCETSIWNRNLNTELMDAGFQVHVLHEKHDSSSQGDNLVYDMNTMSMVNNRVVNYYRQGTQSWSMYSNICRDMASTTEGSMFDVTPLIGGRRRVKRNFIKSFANKVGSSYSIPECQHCRCDPDSENLECKRCDGSSLSNTISDESPSMFYYHTRQ